MANRASVTIRIGGKLPRALLEDLQSAIDIEGLSIDWEGTQFSPTTMPSDAPLDLMADEVAGGELDELEWFCRCHGLVYVRWSGGCCGCFAPQRVVFDGANAPQAFPATDDDVIMISQEEIRRLGSMDAVEEWFAAANRTVPPLIIVDVPESEGASHV